MVTNVRTAHIENFDSVDGIAEAKRELIEALPPEGTAVLNADDPRVATFTRAHSGRSVLYGLSPEAEVRGQDVRFFPEGVGFRVGDAVFTSSFPGCIMFQIFWRSIAVAKVYGVKPERLTRRVPRLRAQENARRAPLFPGNLDL